MYNGYKQLFFHQINDYFFIAKYIKRMNLNFSWTNSKSI